MYIRGRPISMTCFGAPKLTIIIEAINIEMYRIIDNLFICNKNVVLHLGQLYILFDR